MIPRAQRVGLLLLSVLFLGALISSTFFSGRVSADQITARSLTLQAGTVGGSAPGDGNPAHTVNHFFAFTLPSVGAPSVGSILFQYCTTAANSPASPTCVTPLGLDTTGATLGSQNGATSFSIAGSTPNGSPYITRSAASIAAGTPVSYQLLGVVNPDGTSCPVAQRPNCTFFVRISTYASTNATGSPIDTGTVAAATSTQILLSGTMPESLVFCTGGTVSTTSGVPDCATATSGTISFNQLFSPTDTATAVSQMAASTNAGSGYIITVNGLTLTSGSNTITANTSPALGVRGTSQFGLNLKANTTTTSTPAIGTEVAPAANGTNLRGQAATGYDTVDNFKYVTGDTVANSFHLTPGGSDAQIFTVSYMVNVPGSQPAGTYTSTLTYICTPTF